MVNQATPRFQTSDRVRSLETGRTGVIEAVDIRPRTRITYYQVRLDRPRGVLLDYSAEELAPFDEEVSGERYPNDTGVHSTQYGEEHGG